MPKKKPIESTRSDKQNIPKQGVFANLSWTQILIGGLLLSSGAVFLRKVLDKPITDGTDVSSNLRELSPDVCDSFRVIEASAVGSQNISTYIVGDIHCISEENRFDANPETKACVKKLLRQYEQNNKKKVTIINEGKFKDISFDCHKLEDFNLYEDKPTHSNTEIVCTGMEPEEGFILIAQAYIFQRISRNYKMSLSKKIPVMEIELDLKYEAIDLRKYFHGLVQRSREEGKEQLLLQGILLSAANDLFIARRKELGSYANVLKVFSKLDEIEAPALFSLQKNIDDVDREYTAGNINGPQFVEDFEKRNQAFLETIETHCTPDTPCIAIIGDHHMQTHLYESTEDVLSKFPVYGWAARGAQKVRDALGRHAHKNPFVYLSPEADVTDYPSHEPEDISKPRRAVRTCKSFG